MYGGSITNVTPTQNKHVCIECRTNPCNFCTDVTCCLKENNFKMRAEVLRFNPRPTRSVSWGHTRRQGVNNVFYEKREYQEKRLK